MFGYVLLATFALGLPQRAVSSPTGPYGDSQQPLTIQEKHRPLRYAAFGDSWASGISYGAPGEEVEYDFPDSDEVCRCRRSNYAYAVQLRDDSNKTWAGDRDIELDLRACHGSFFPSIPEQVDALTIEPDFATLMIGGNNAGFPELVEDCIFQYNLHKDYGPQYPDENGACYKTLKRTRNSLDTAEYSAGLVSSIKTILDSPKVKSNPKFRLYVLGYAGLFNHDDLSCNGWTFGVFPGKKQYLNKELRHAVNDIIDAGRTLYDYLINHFLFDPRVRYLDINDAFAGHRFCEPTKGNNWQDQVANSWIWSLEWPTCIPLGMSIEGEELWRRSDEFSFRKIESWIGDDGEPAPECPGFCRNCGGWNELGEAQRPFHPKPEGHEAIKNLLKATIEKDPLGAMHTVETNVAEADEDEKLFRSWLTETIKEYSDLEV